MRVNNMIVNNVWTPVLMITSDTAQTYGPVIDDGNKRYNVTPLKSWQEHGKYHYWFIINSTVIVDQTLKHAVDDLTEANTALGHQVTALTLPLADKDALIAQLGQQMVQTQLDVAALKGDTAS